MKKFCDVFMKSIALIVMMLVSYNGLAQDYTYNIGYGNNKVYLLDNERAYVANIISSKEKSFAKELKADKITICVEDYTWSFSSPYGYFIEFIQSGQPAMMTDDFDMMVLDGSNLYLVTFYPDLEMKVVGTITNDLNNIGDDFQIFYEKSRMGSSYNSVYIMNNGILKSYTYKTIKNTSSVRSHEVDKSESKTYTLDGKQVDSPLKGLFIKDRKKVIIK